MGDVYYLVCYYCLASKHQATRLGLNRRDLIFACPTCGGGYTCQLLLSLIGYTP